MSKLFSPHAYWIGSAHPFDLHEAYINFRRVFELNEFSNVQFAVAADSRYKLWVNGKFVARGPERSFPQNMSADTLALTPFVQRGKNIIAIQIYSPGYSHFSYVHRGAHGLLAELRADGQTLFVTDQTWRAKRDASFDEIVPRVSIYGSGVEVRDMARDENWRGLDYDDAQWETPRIVAVQNATPWENVSPRVTPLLVERAQNMMLLETRAGAAVTHRDTHLALREGWTRAARTAFSQNNAEWFTPRVGENETVYWLYDLGCDYIAQGWAEIENARGGEGPAEIHAARRAALRQRLHPYRPCAEQDPQGHRHAQPAHDRQGLRLCAGLGLPRPADRMEDRGRELPRQGQEEARFLPSRRDGRLPPRMPRLCGALALGAA